MKFRHRPTEVDAIQWMKEGDCPAERSMQDISSIQAHLHTSLVIPTGADGSGPYLDLHPRDFIVTHEDGHREVLSSKDFQRNYEMVPIPPHVPRYAHL